MTGTIETRAARQAPQAQDIAAAQDDEALLTVDTVAALTGFAVKTIREWERQGRFPKAIRLGPRCVRWRAGVVREWLREARIAPRP